MDCPLRGPRVVYGKNSMEPLTPDDLLIRRSPVELERWLEGERPSHSPPTVALERFQTLEHVIRDNPLTVEPYLELARIYLQRNRWVDARRVLELATQRFPGHEEASFLYEEAQLARSLQLHWEAQATHRDEPTRLTEDRLDRSRIELNVLREKVCRARLQRHPQQLELYLPLATALVNLERPAEAIACLQLALGQPKLRSAAAWQLGQLYESQQRIPEALSAYRRAALFRVPPPAADIKRRALAAAADLAERSGLIDSARRYVGLLLELEPNDMELKARHLRLLAMPL
jgi:tetratricopeptide (TPR) repeat protein